jgi:hypothetical protein
MALELAQETNPMMMSSCADPVGREMLKVPPEVAVP